MFEGITDGLKGALSFIERSRLTEANVREGLGQVRQSLLEADVDLKVTRSFLERVKERSLGEKIETRVKDRSGRKIRVTPGQHFIKICEEELTDLMALKNANLERFCTLVNPCRLP